MVGITGCQHQPGLTVPEIGGRRGGEGSGNLHRGRASAWRINYMGEGSRFSPWVDTPYLRDRFWAPSAAPRVRSLQRAGLLLGPVCCSGARRNQRAGVSVSWSSCALEVG